MIKQLETLAQITNETQAPFILPNGFICLQFVKDDNTGEGVVLAMYPGLKHGRQEFASWRFYRNDLTSTSHGEFTWNDLEHAAHIYQERVQDLEPIVAFN